MKVILTNDLKLHEKESNHLIHPNIIINHLFVWSIEYASDFDNNIFLLSKFSTFR